MEEIEVEILTDKENWEREIPVQVEVAGIQVPVQTMIVNGEEHTFMGNAYALVCPKCRAVVQKFQVGTSDIDIQKSLCTDKETLLNSTIYCQKCGQKLKVFKPMPVEGTYENIN